MAHHSGLIINLTIKVDSGVLLLAKHRALLERTSINRHLAEALEDYADGTMDAARRTNSAAYVFGVIEEVRRVKRRSKAARRPIDAPAFVGDGSAHQTPFAQHDSTDARPHDRTKAV